MKYTKHRAKHLDLLWALPWVLFCSFITLLDFFALCVVSSQPLYYILMTTKGVMLLRIKSRFSQACSSFCFFYSSGTFISKTFSIIFSLRFIFFLSTFVIFSPVFGVIQQQQTLAFWIRKEWISLVPSCRSTNYKLWLIRSSWLLTWFSSHYFTVLENHFGDSRAKFLRQFDDWPHMIDNYI